MYIIMEYADAGDLNHRIRAQRRPFTEQQVLNYFTQLALAIKHLHDRKCLHRDIKAENIFLTSGDRIKLGDFGISTLLRQRSRAPSRASAHRTTCRPRSA